MEKQGDFKKTTHCDRKPFLKNHYDQNTSHRNKMKFRNYAKNRLQENARVKFKFKTKLNVSYDTVHGKSPTTDMKADLNHVGRACEKGMKSSTVGIEIVTGNGLSVPVCDGEEVVSFFF